MNRRPCLPVLIALVSVTAASIGLLAIRSAAPSPAPLPAEMPRQAESAREETAEPPVASPPDASAPETSVGRAGGEVPRRQRRPGEPLRIPAGQPIPEVFPHQKERDEIQNLAATYDAKRIPEIAVFLDHADPLVRAAALQGLIQLSSPEAVPVLRAAAARAKNAEEAAALREAAEFLSQTGPG